MHLKSKDADGHVTAEGKGARNGRHGPGAAFVVALLLLVPLLAVTVGGGPAPAPGRDGAPDGPLPPPTGFLGHRPLLELFTGLSCPSCMAGPHPELEAMYEGIRDDESVPWTYVVFHELNGRGIDGLATDESRDRMRYYQPGVSGTPDAEVDGGWSEMGGMYQKPTPNTANAQTALAAATVRYERSFDPFNIRDSLRNDFKFVNLEVQQHYEDGQWVVIVNIDYLGMDRILIEEDLDGILYVFMVEDDVTAYSDVEEADVLNHNVFRGYAIEGQQFTMSPGEEQIFSGVWEIPNITIDPNKEYPAGTPVPIKTMDITAVAAVFDMDDTSSADGRNGNPNPVPRCIQSATARSTAYDMDNTATAVGEVTVSEEDGTLYFVAAIDDPDGVATAALHWSTEGPDSPKWSAVQMGVDGEEVCDDEGVCYAYADATASAQVEANGADEIWYVVTFTDGLGAMGKSEILAYDVGAAVPSGGGGSIGGGVAIAIVMMLLIAVLAYLMFKTPDKANRTALAAVMVMVIIIGSVFALSAGGGEGDMAPDIEFTDLDGNTLSLSDFKGKVVVLDIMATWCPTCKVEMAELKVVHERYGDSIELITVDIDAKESPAQLRDFQREYGAQWRFTMDNEAQDFFKEFKVEFIPLLVVIDTDGGIVFAEAEHIPAIKLIEVIDKAAMGGGALISLGAGSTSALGLMMWALGLGALTFFSPCSFPLLPGYMTYYLGLRESRNQRKSIYGGMAAAMGIDPLFLVVAILVGIFGSTISGFVVVLEPIVGVLLIAMAILIILDININFGLLTYPVKKGLAFSRKAMGRLRSQWKVEDGATSDNALATAVDEGGYVGLYFFGLGYGAASAGCMAPVVIALIVLAAAQGTFLGAFAVFMVFALAMAVLMVVITVMVGQYGGVLIDKLRVNPKTVKMFTSLMLFAVGVYVIMYFISGLA